MVRWADAGGRGEQLENVSRNTPVHLFINIPVHMLTASQLSSADRTSRKNRLDVPSNCRPA